MNDLKTMDLLPNDEETAQWFEDNIGIVNDCSASSAIYKFRLWLKDRQQYADQQAKKEAISFLEWIENNYAKYMEEENLYRSILRVGKPYTREELYNLYIQSKQI